MSICATAQGRPPLDGGLLAEAVAALRSETDLIVQLSTGGSVHDPFDARLAVLDARPDSCSLTTGTVNFGDDVFHNPWPFVVELYRRTQELGILPEFELFDLGHVAALLRLLDKHGAPAGGHVHADFVLGVPGGDAGNACHALAAAVGDASVRRDLVGDGDRTDESPGDAGRHSGWAAGCGSAWRTP